MTYQIKSISSDNTIRLGEKLGARCRGGEVFLLSSDLGGGKTTMSKGIVRGIGSNDLVSSPTFTVSNIYESDNGITIYHYDFYRLNQGGVVEQELQEILYEPSNVILLEWGDVVDDSLPQDMVRISINRLASAEHDRQIDIILPAKLNYLGKDL